MSIKALQDYTYYSKSARYNKEAGRRETWSEAIDRVKKMHIDKFPHIKEDIEWAFDQSKQKRVLGSQRALQYGGTPIIRKNARMYNCTSSFCDRPRFFQECLWLLLCGCGTGFSVQKHHIEKIPKFHKSRINNDPRDEKVFQIPDDIEGWSDALGILMASFIPVEEFKEWYGVDVEFDYSLIRPAGSYLSSGVGKAPGPSGLKRSLDIIKDMLETRVKQGYKRLRPIDAYDIVMHSSDAVLSGGVRRSATICIFSIEDEEMMAAKTGNWAEENPQRARSNNSVLLLRGKVTKEKFAEIMHSVKEWGEPGFFWSDSMEQIPNPCFSGDTRILTKDGWKTIKSMYDHKKKNDVIIDNRALAGDRIELDKVGVSCQPATEVRLTQKKAKLFEVVTSHGHSLKVTNNHEFPTLRGRLKLKDMKEGDSILLQSGKGNFGSFGNLNQGLLLGMLVGDGTICGEEAMIDIWEDDFENKDEILDMVNKEISQLPNINNGRQYDDLTWNVQSVPDNSPFKKRIGGRRLFRWLKEVLRIDNPFDIKNKIQECVWSGSENFVRGFLQGLIFADGTVALSGHDKSRTLSVRINQSNKILLQEVMIVLNNFGVISRNYLRKTAQYRMMPDGRGGQKEYWCKDNYELIINRPNSILLRDVIGLYGRKKKTLDSYILSRGLSCNKPEHYITRIKSIKYFGIEDVYCLTQPKTNTVIANGCVVGQCVEIGMFPVLKTDKGEESGWQFCNLCEINGKKIKTKKDFEIAARAGAIIGTLQAAYTKFDYLGTVSEQIVEKEALLGVSITGMMDNPDIIFDPDIQKEMAKLVVKTNIEFATKIGINPAARCTCVKPAGTTSCILGSSSGIHPHHARRYFRRVQANIMENPLLHFKKTNPLAVEPCVWSSNNSDEVITFVVEVPDGSKTKNETSAIDLLKMVKLTQQNWVKYGKSKDRCSMPWLSHNVSNTINVQSDEWDKVRDFIFENQEWFAGVSLLPQSGDLDYPQAPFTNVSTDKEIVQKYGVGALLVSGLIVDGLHAYGDLWKGCKDVLNFKNIFNLDKNKEDWIRRVNQFSERYCNGDIKRCTYLMKEVNNWKLWLDLTREYKEVDYTTMFEDKDNTKVMETIACAGGTCSI